MVDRLQDCGCYLCSMSRGFSATADDDVEWRTPMLPWSLWYVFSIETLVVTFLFAQLMSQPLPLLIAGISLAVGMVIVGVRQRR